MSTYANLKNLMRNLGYEVSKCEEWLAADTQHFIAFATRELGVPYSIANHMLAYPQAFPNALKRIEELHAGLGTAPAPAAAPVVPPQDTQTVAPVQEPDVGTNADEDSSMLNLSADNQSEPQAPVVAEVEEPASNVTDDEVPVEEAPVIAEPETEAVETEQPAEVEQTEAEQVEE